MGSVNLAAPRRILIVTLSNIGDVILTMPVIHSVLQVHPDAAVTVVVGPRAAGVLARERSLASVLVYEKRAPWRAQVAFVRTLRRVVWDLVVDLRHSALPWLVRCHRRPAPWRRIPAAVVHARDRHLWVLQAAGIPAAVRTPRVRWAVEDEVAIDRAFTEAGWRNAAPVVAVCPGGRDARKRWPYAQFAVLVERLVRDGCRVVVVGDAEDHERAEALAAIGQGRPLVLAGRTTLPELAALLRRCAVLVTPDTAPMHLAVAVGTPVVAVFGPTDPARYGPLGPRDVVLRRASVDRVPPEVVWGAVRTALERPARPMARGGGQGDEPARARG